MHSVLPATTPHWQKLSWNSATCVLCLAIMSIVSACGGSPAPTNYSCGGGAGGCYGSVQWTAAQLGGTPWAVTTDLFNAPLTCNSGCAAENGHIRNYIEVVDGSYTYYVRTGYTLDNMGVTRFEWQDYLPEGGGTFNGHIMDGVPSVGSDVNQYVTHTIDFFPAPGGVQSFEVSLRGPHTSYVQQGAPTAMTPSYLVFAVNLFGTHGATAQYSLFTSSRIRTTLLPSYDPNIVNSSTWASYFPTASHIHTDVVPGLSPAGPPQNPLYARWLVKPSVAGATGGSFGTACCGSL